MNNLLQTAALATLPLGLSAGSGFAQASPQYPSDYRPGNAHGMSIGPDGREAYRSMYYSVAPGSGYYPGYSYSPRLPGVYWYPTANAEAPLASGYSSRYYTPPPSNPDAATIDVIAPPGARLWFQGRETRQQGPQRFFQSPPLRPGETYAYEVTARWTDENGGTVERTRIVPVRAGAHITLDLRGPAS